MSARQMKVYRNLKIKHDTAYFSHNTHLRPQSARTETTEQCKVLMHDAGCVSVPQIKLMVIITISCKRLMMSPCWAGNVVTAFTKWCRTFKLTSYVYLPQIWNELKSQWPRPQGQGSGHCHQTICYIKLLYSTRAFKALYTASLTHPFTHNYASTFLLCPTTFYPKLTHLCQSVVEWQWCSNVCMQHRAMDQCLSV